MSTSGGFDIDNIVAVMIVDTPTNTKGNLNIHNIDTGFSTPGENYRVGAIVTKDFVHPDAAGKHGEPPDIDLPDLEIIVHAEGLDVQLACTPAFNVTISAP